MKFILVYPEHAAAGANSGGVGFQEVTAEQLRADLRPDNEVFKFMETAKPGDYLQFGGRFIFRTS